MSDLSTQARAAARLAEGALVVDLAGDWRLTAPRPRWAAVVAGQWPAPVPALRVRAGGVGTWDSALALFLHEARQAAEAAGARFEPEELPAGVARLLELLARAPDRPAPPPAPTPDLFVAVGRAAGALWGEARDLSHLVGECVFSMGRFFRGQAQFRWKDCLHEMQQCGLMALPIVGLVSFLVGVTLAYTGVIVVRQYGGDIWVADMVGLAVVREMGPVMAAIVLAGRTGAAFAATLGNMKANDEIDALATLGVSPVDFLVMPRVVALCLMMPLLTLYADTVAILGGVTIAALPPLNIPFNLFWAEMQTIVDLSDINTGILKAGGFGLLIGIAGCLRGLQADRSAVGVGVAATRAVVTGVLLIVMADALGAVVFDALGW